jgi:Glycoside Hydrolase Family 113
MPGTRLAACSRRTLSSGGGAAGVIVALVVLGGLALTIPSAWRSPSGARVAEADKRRGVNYAHEWRDAEALGYGTPASAASLGRLKAIGVTSIAITPFGFQSAPDDRAIRWGGDRFSETDDRLRQVTSQAHALGIRVLLKPHIWLRPPAWVGLIEQRSEEGWAAWFAAYRGFILHYAALAGEAGMDGLCVGNELGRTTAREREWRELIREVRRSFSGELTYGATVEEVRRIRFWDAFDFIGISAYFPLVNAASPGREELVRAWAPIVRELGQLSARWQKPIVFTELGYRSADFGAWRQWEVRRDAPVNLQLQADAYSAFFQAVWPQPWFGGVYWWKWWSFLDSGGLEDNDYTPRNKPAERVLESGFFR